MSVTGGLAWPCSLRRHRESPLPQVSHHVQCNDEALDEDVFSAFPALRFDARLPRRPWHRWQHIYMVSGVRHCVGLTMHLAARSGDIRMVGAMTALHEACRNNGRTAIVGLEC